MSELARKMQALRGHVQVPWDAGRQEAAWAGVERRRRRRGQVRAGAAIAVLLVVALGMARGWRRGGPEVARVATPATSPLAVPPTAAATAPATAAATAPLAPVPGEVVKRRAARVASWKALAQEGRFEQAFSLVGEKRVSEVTDEPGDLLLLADVARLSHHSERAVAPLERVVRGHARDPRAPLAAFTLGRVLLDELGRPEQAAGAFRRAQELDPGGAMTEDALAREVEAWSRAGDAAAARERAEEYLRRFPGGRRVRSVRRYGAVE